MSDAKHYSGAVKLKEYLKSETQKYFPESKITVTLYAESDAIKINTEYLTFWHKAGSDDDWYMFASQNGTSFTIPLMAEEP